VKEDLYIKNGIVIPGHELEISVSRAGGPGGQHVNKTSTRVTVRWNVHSTSVLTPEQKSRMLEKLGNQVTAEGDIMVHDSSSRSQLTNKKNALRQLAEKIRRALAVPKKRMATVMSEAVKKARVQEKKQRGEIKKMRNKKFYGAE
jgi:ribosome-associated protein